MKALLLALILCSAASATNVDVPFAGISVYGGNLESAITIDLNLGPGAEVFGLGFAMQANKTDSGTNVFKPSVRMENHQGGESVSFVFYSNSHDYPIPWSLPPGPLSQLPEVSPSPPPALLVLPDGILRLIVKDIANPTRHNLIGTISGTIVVRYNIPPKITQFTATSSQFNLEWASQANAFYRVEISPDLVTWLNYTTVKATGPTSSVSVPRSTFPLSTGFTRVVNADS